MGGNVGVDFGGLTGAVAQQRLDVAQISALLQ